MKVSVLIPSRNEPYLNRTIAEVFDNAHGEVECLVLLDGAPPVEPVDKRAIVLSNDKPQGLGAGTWQMANLATGDFLLKLDAHCMLGPGYDTILSADCDDLDLLVPSRYQLKADEWQRGYGPIDYLYMTYPWLCEPQFGWGLHGKKWKGQNGLEGHYFWLEKKRKDIKLDDIQTFQGSMWFMRRKRFLELDGIDRRYWLSQEASDLGFKVWLSGGRCLVDKRTWYAHLHKGNQHGRGYFVSKPYEMRSNRYAADYWMNDRWPNRVRGIRWWVEHFQSLYGLPGWPVDWNNPKYQAEFEGGIDGRG